MKYLLKRPIEYRYVSSFKECYSRALIYTNIPKNRMLLTLNIAIYLKNKNNKTVLSTKYHEDLLKIEILE